MVSWNVVRRHTKLGGCGGFAHIKYEFVDKVGGQDYVRTE